MFLPRIEPMSGACVSAQCAFGAHGQLRNMEASTKQGRTDAPRLLWRWRTGLRVKFDCAIACVQPGYNAASYWPSGVLDDRRQAKHRRHVQPSDAWRRPLNGLLVQIDAPRDGESGATAGNRQSTAASCSPGATLSTRCRPRRSRNAWTRRERARSAVSEPLIPLPLPLPERLCSSHAASNAEFRVREFLIILSELHVVAADLIVAGNFGQLRAFFRSLAIVRCADQGIGHNRTLPLRSSTYRKTRLRLCRKNQFGFARYPQAGVPSTGE
jgi:hypothetical protein